MNSAVCVPCVFCRSVITIACRADRLRLKASTASIRPLSVCKDSTRLQAMSPSTKLGRPPSPSQGMEGVQIRRSKNDTSDSEATCSQIWMSVTGRGRPLLADCRWQMFRRSRGPRADGRGVEAVQIVVMTATAASSPSRRRSVSVPYYLPCNASPPSPCHHRHNHTSHTTTNHSPIHTHA